MPKEKFMRSARAASREDGLANAEARARNVREPNQVQVHGP